PGNPTVDFHGERRSNATHGSTTDPDARLFRKAKGHEAKLVYQGHVLMDNGHGLAVEGCVTRASGYGERAAALEMLGHRATAGRITVGADKGYDTRDFVEALRLFKVTPHVAQNKSHSASEIDGRTTRHDGYRVSQWKRKRVEEILGWLKTVGLLRKTRHSGPPRVSWMFVLRLAVCSLVGIRSLGEATGGAQERRYPIRAPGRGPERSSATCFAPLWHQQACPFHPNFLHPARGRRFLLGRLPGAS